MSEIQFLNWIAFGWFGYIVVRLVCVLCAALVELLVLDACLVMDGVERDPFCCNFDYFVFYFPFRLGS